MLMITVFIIMFAIIISYAPRWFCCCHYANVINYCHDFYYHFMLHVVPNYFYYIRLHVITFFTFSITFCLIKISDYLSVNAQLVAIISFWCYILRLLQYFSM